MLARTDPALALAAAIPVGGPDRLAFGWSRSVDATGFIVRAGAWARGTTRGGVEYGAFGAAFLEHRFSGETDCGALVGVRLRW